LKESEKLSENNPRCQAITFNNMACYYKRLGHTRTALIYLERALELEGYMEDSSFKADTHLNISAVLSQMGRHDLAMHHAQSSVMIIQSSLL
jgi:tetratricopeptide (TPR) repeat protein